jgi:hypothetical protein
MSETIPPDDIQIARAAYDRMLAETRKFSAEQNKLAEEAGKFAAEQNKLAAEQIKLAAEQNKLAAEAGKLQRDRQLLPWQVLVTLLGAGAALFAAGAACVKLFGG